MGMRELAREKRPHISVHGLRILDNYRHMKPTRVRADDAGRSSPRGRGPPIVATG
jgi:hypothetical protein